MTRYSRLALTAAAAVAAGIYQVLALGEGNREAALAAHDVMAVMEHMLTVNGFTAGDAAILSLEMSRETPPASQDPGV